MKNKPKFVRAKPSQKQVLLGRFLRMMRIGAKNQALINYDLMTSDNQKQSELYKAGKFWSQINHDFIDLMWTGALDNLRNQYFNRRFAGPEPCSRKVYKTLLWVYYSQLLEIDKTGFLKSASEPLPGGTADQELIDGRPMSLDFLQSVEEAYRLKNAWELSGRANSPQLIVEIGGGYGRLAYVCRQIMPECTYVILDLPEALICSSTWLSQVLPGEILPYAESRQKNHLNRGTLMAHKVWTLGAHQIEQIAPDTVDAFVSIYSFAEMPIKTIENYFQQIDRITDGILYTKQRKLETNIDDGVEINLDTYPIPKNWRVLFHQTSTLYQDFFEVAYDIPDKGNSK